MQLRKASFIASASAISMLLLGGACSQHEPGDYQGGGECCGRTIPTSQIGPAAGGPVTVDASYPDIQIPDSTPPSDALQIPDTIQQPD